MKSNDYQRNTGLDNSFKQTEGDRLDDIVFSKNYAETISEIINFATIIYNKKLLICAYLYDDVSDDIRQLYFLGEMGGNFAFMGNQYHLNVDGNDFYIDLLLYHRSLKSLVAIELKIGEFKPEYVGQMNM